MTDTGQNPGEGQPENAGAQPAARPGTPAPGPYPYPGPDGGVGGGAAAPGEEDLLMPGAQGAWSDAQATAAQQDPYSRQAQPQQQARQQYPAPAGNAPGQHETDGRDSGSVDFGAVRAPLPDAPAVNPNPTPNPSPPRRPLHLGPPEPEQSGAVRPLSDRGRGKTAPGPAAAPVSPPQPEAAQVPARQADPMPPGVPPAAAATNGPEYLDVSQQSPDPLPGPQLGALPPPHDSWAAQGEQPRTAEPEANAQTQEATGVAGPQLASSPAGEAVPSQPAPVSEGPSEVSAQPQPQPQPSTEPEPEPEPAEAGETRQRRGSTEGGTESTGNTWVSTPGSTAVEAISPQEQDVPEPLPAPAGDGEAAAHADTPADSAVPAPGAADTADIPAQQQADPDAAQADAGTPASAPGPEAVAGIPAQQQGAPAEASAAEMPSPAPQDEAGSPEAVTMVPRQGQHAEPEANPADPADPVRPAGPADNVSQSAEVPTAAGEPAPVETEAESETETGSETEAESETAPLISEDGSAAVAAPSPDGEADDGEAGSGPDSGPDVSATGTATAPAPAPAGPPAPGFADDEREAVHRLMRERRDIRKGFRPDPIPHEVLLRVLEAAHTAPSVGHSQPWDFVVIRSEETRRAMHELAERQREAYAKSLPKGRAKQFKELKIEAILDTPVNIVVTADPTRGGRHTLGRHTQPQMAPYSSALAVENLWLAARAEGLGVGWVSFFDEREMVRSLELPEHLEVVAYLCVGYVDEFPPEPELAQAGWSKRRPLSWVVHEESYGRRVLPGAEPQDLLADTVAAIRPLDAKALGEAWERQKRMTKPSGALGMLEIISAQLCGLSRKCPPPLPEPAAVAVFAGDHGVHAQGVTPWPQEVTAQMVANFLGGGAVCNAFANQVGAEVCVIDVGVVGELPATPGLLPRKVRAGTADMTQGPALTREEALRAVEVGIETARDLVAAGNKALVTGEMGIANTTASAALIAACTGVDAAEVTGRGTGINDETHARKVEVVRRALELHQPDPADPVGLLAAVGGLEHAALVGMILGGASLRTPVILDGVSAGAAALVARCIAPEALAACVAGHRSSEPGHVVALTKLGLRPLVDLDLRLGEGTGALLALPMVQSAARAMHEVATFDSAGVTGKG
ncbi:MAG: nicotinate-nucleotide--dimethylbenzimidazole phosphoribosyltransferase [Streptomyces sp.]|uniref:nicotinate-nucleotide--dimethylbenzimidazole phosphoribosyltransferase n=1 Tax=Streptomyces sp. TaxID=1931 RepID=UPI003D6B3342